MITLVHAPACHFCSDAQAALEELSRRYPIEVDLVAADSDTGRALADHDLLTTGVLAAVISKLLQLP